jgi:hypothetical protein
MKEIMSLPRIQFVYKPVMAHRIFAVESGFGVTEGIIQEILKNTLFLVTMRWFKTKSVPKKRTKTPYRDCVLMFLITFGRNE